MIGRGLLFGARLCNGAQCWEQRLVGNLVLRFWCAVLLASMWI
jgi:hypothetical protein